MPANSSLGLGRITQPLTHAFLIHFSTHFLTYDFYNTLGFILLDLGFPADFPIKIRKKSKLKFAAGID